jgi:hypothetical protein
MSKQAGPSTPESIVSHYRRTRQDPRLSSANVELELRFGKVEYGLWSAVLATFARAEFPEAAPVELAGEPELTCTVNTIEKETDRESRARHRGTQPSLVRVRPFVGGKQQQSEYMKKWQLETPYRSHSAAGLNYRIELNAEEPMRTEFRASANVLLRAKLRASFPFAHGEGRWRADFTVVREIRGSEAAAMEGIVAAMFRGPMAKATPADFAQRLGLDREEVRALYAFELELEHVAAAPEDRDTVKAGDLGDLAATVLELAQPGTLAEARFQAAVYDVARLAVQAPGVLAKFRGEWGLKKLSPQVVALSKAAYLDMWPPVGWYVTDKADGIHAVCYAIDGHMQLLGDELREYAAPELPAEQRGATAVDGELIVEPAKGKRGPTLRFYAFDVIAVAGESVAQLGFEARVARLDEATAIVAAHGLAAEPKPFVRLTADEPEGLRAQFQDPTLTERPYELDGRVFVKEGAPFRDTEWLKWKPEDQTTIDFLAVLPPPAHRSRAPYADRAGHTLYLLFVGISADLYAATGLWRCPGYADLFGARPQPYFPIQFAPSRAPGAYLYYAPAGGPDLDRKIVELRVRGGAAALAALKTPADPVPWELVRVREDRRREQRSGYFGNDFRVAELTLSNVFNPLLEAELWDGPDTGYFAVRKLPMYRAQTAFTSFVKTQRVEQLAGAEWVVDIAAGNGQDLRRYLDAGVKHLVAVDRDTEALTELIRRKYRFQAPARGDRSPPRNRRGVPARLPRPASTAVYAVATDVNAGHEAVAEKVRALKDFPAGGADALVCNLAVHYFAERTETLENFADLCLATVKPGGRVVITTMMGGRVNELLAEVPEGEQWEAHEAGVLKYALKKKYVGTKLEPSGQTVGVLLPFSNGALYDEYLVNFAEMQRLFLSRGFVLSVLKPFDKSFAEFAARSPGVDRALTADDRKWLSLYGELVFTRK